MLVSYKVTRYANLPDQVGVNTGKGLLMLDCEKNDDAYIGRELARYAGELKEKYDIEAVIWISDDEEYTVVARKNAEDYDAMYEDENDYFDEDDELFYQEKVEAEELVEVLGKAFAAIEKEVAPKEKEPSVKKDCPKEKSLKELRKLLDALFDDE